MRNRLPDPHPCALIVGSHRFPFNAHFIPFTALHGGDGAGLFPPSPQAGATLFPRVASWHVLNGRPGDDVSSFHTATANGKAVQDHG